MEVEGLEEGVRGKAGGEGVGVPSCFGSWGRVGEVGAELVRKIATRTTRAGRKKKEHTLRNQDVHQPPARNLFRQSQRADHDHNLALKPLPQLLLDLLDIAQMSLQIAREREPDRSGFGGHDVAEKSLGGGGGHERGFDLEADDADSESGKID